MDTPDQARIRRAAQDAAERTGMRKVARQVGLSVGGLQKFLRGSDPFDTTWAKLRDWYTREYIGQERSATEAAHAALETLVQQCPPAVRDRVRVAIAAEVGIIHGEEGLPVPAWVTEVREGLEAYEAGARTREVGLAVVELARGDPFRVPLAAFKGDPREVVERIGRELGAWNGDVYHPPHRIARVTFTGGK